LFRLSNFIIPLYVNYYSYLDIWLVRTDPLDTEQNIVILLNILSPVIFPFIEIDRMVVGFITTYAISAYHHKCCECESRSWRSVLDTTLCDKVCQWLAAGRWFSSGTPVSSTNKMHYNLNIVESGVKHHNPPYNVSELYYFILVF